MRDEVDKIMMPLLGKKVIFRLTDMNGRVYLIGSPDDGVNLSINQNTGQTYVNENGSEFLFDIAQVYPALTA
ncbi:hypothetical protein D3C87_1835590 [compost metagenome]